VRKKGRIKLGADTPTLIAEDTHVMGELRFQGSLEIEGEVTGNILAQEAEESAVRVLDKGLVRGEVRVPSVYVSGRVHGDIHADRLVELATDSVVEGNVYYNVLQVEKGAQVNGSLVQGKQAQEVSKTVEPSDQSGGLEQAGTGLCIAPKQA
tara:strand:+ start:9178 stop:9633 length:456 start_codon:yes stop_codon:yes gene_type:complete